MTQYDFHIILRFFYRYSTDMLILFQSGKILGYLLKGDVEEILSDLSISQASMDEIPHKPFSGTTELIHLFEKYAVEVEGKKVVPSLNSRMEFSSLWELGDLIKSFEAVPSVKEWKPPLASERFQSRIGTVESPSPQERILEISVDTSYRNWKMEKNPHHVESTISEKKLLQEEKIPESADNLPEDFERNVSIYTLEALPVPMLAVTKKGDIIFQNQEWKNLFDVLKSRYSIRGLLEKSKDEMARMAYEGTFDRESIVPVLTMKEHIINCRPIISATLGRSYGYLFWMEKRSPVSGKDHSPEHKNPLPMDSGKEDSPPQAKKYLGFTLNEILEEEERKVLLWAFEEASGNFSNAAMLLGIPRQTFTYRYNKYFRSGK